MRPVLGFLGTFRGFAGRGGLVGLKFMSFAWECDMDEVGHFLCLFTCSWVQD